jgi:hypothetical protein
MKSIGVISTAAVFLLLRLTVPAYAGQEKQEEKAPPKQEQPAKPEKQQQAKPQQQHTQQQAKGQQDQQQKQQQQQHANADKQQQQHAQQQAKGQQDQQQKQQQQQQANANKQQQQHAQQQAKGQQQDLQRQGQQDNAARQVQPEARVQEVKMQSQQQQRRQEGEQRSAWEDHRAKNWQSEHRDWQQRGGYNGYRIPDDRYNGYFGSRHSFRIYSYPVVLVGGFPRFQYGGFWFAMVDPWPEYWSDNWYDNDDVYIDYSGDGYYLYNRRYPRDRIAVEVYMN